MSNKNNNKSKRKIVLSIAGVITFLLILIFMWGTSSYKPQNVANQSLVSDSKISIVVDDNITFTPQNTKPTKGFIFYPGAKVEPSAYAPLCKKIAEQGYEVIIVKMPLNFAVLSSNRAEDVINKYDDIKTWAIGGHSLGGVMASKYASEDDRIDAVALLASYPQGEELKNLDKKVVSIWGSKDGVLNFEELEKSKNNLPSDTQFVEIEGGNHAQFGDYGEQKGDNIASISQEEQIDKSAQIIINLLNKLDVK